MGRTRQAHDVAERARANQVQHLQDINNDLQAAEVAETCLGSVVTNVGGWGCEGLETPV